MKQACSRLRVTAAATLAQLVGAFLLLGGLLRLGFVANFISLTVLTGFKAGIGLVIFVNQLPKVLGVSGEAYVDLEKEAIAAMKRD
jgi:MFS superfamily sulfate permease-like transporter